MREFHPLRRSAICIAAAALLAGSISIGSISEAAAQPGFCRYGQDWDPSSGTCVPDGYARGRCGYGFDYDWPSGRCVPDGYARGRCPLGYDWHYKLRRCVPDGYAPKPYQPYRPYRW